MPTMGSVQMQSTLVEPKYAAAPRRRTLRHRNPPSSNRHRRGCTAMPTMGLFQMQGTGRAEVVGIAEGKNSPIGRHQPVAATVGGDGHAATMGFVQMEGTGRAEVRRAPEREDAAVRRHFPVAIAVRCRRQPDNRGVEVVTRHRTEVTGPSERKDAPVRRHLPVAITIGGRRQSDHWGVEGQSTGRAVEAGPAEGRRHRRRRRPPQ